MNLLVICSMLQKSESFWICCFVALCSKISMCAVRSYVLEPLCWDSGSCKA